MNKRGFSEVIVIVLVILVSISLILVLGYAVLNFIDSEKHEIEVRSVSDVNLKIEKTVLSSNKIYMHLKNTGSREITGLKILTTSPAGSKEENIITNISIFESLVINFTAPFGNNPENYLEIRVYSKFIYDSEEVISSTEEKVEAQAIIKNTSSIQDNLYYKDSDNDRYGDGTSSLTLLEGYKSSLDLIALEGDCNDDNPDINPNEEEICNDLDDNCNSQIDENSVCHDYSEPFYTETTFYNDLSSFTDYSSLKISPLIDAGTNNELIHHWITIDYSGTGTVKASIGHNNANDIFSTLSNPNKYTPLTQLISQQEHHAYSPYIKERYAWLILEITGDVTINKINHTRWVGFNTAYGHEPRTFQFEKYAFNYRILFPKNYNSSENKNYPLIISLPGSGGVGPPDNNLDQMEQVGYGRYYFERYYFDPEFDGISVVVQPSYTPTRMTDSLYYMNSSNSIINSSRGQGPRCNDSLGCPPNPCPSGNCGYCTYPCHLYYLINVQGYYNDGIKTLIQDFLQNTSMNIDTKRIYYTGFSYGGGSAFQMMLGLNETWAGVWPIGSWPIGIPYRDYTTLPETDNTIQILKSDVQRYKHIPIQISSGDLDDLKFGGNLACREINAAGGSCIHHILPGAGHVPSAGKAYENITQLRWLFNQHK